MGPAPIASAADADTRAAKFYIYQHDDYKGGWYGFTGSDRDFTNNYWTNASNSINNGASSMKNRTSRAVVLHDLRGYGGRTYYAKPNSSDRDLTNNGFDNKASSVQFK